MFPVVATEWGLDRPDTALQGGWYSNSILQYMNSRNMSYIAWAWVQDRLDYPSLLGEGFEPTGRAVIPSEEEPSKKMHITGTNTAARNSIPPFVLATAIKFLIMPPSVLEPDKRCPTFLKDVSTLCQVCKEWEAVVQKSAVWYQYFNWEVGGLKAAGFKQKVRSFDWKKWAQIRHRVLLESSPEDYFKQFYMEVKITYMVNNERYGLYSSIGDIKHDWDDNGNHELRLDPMTSSSWGLLDHEYDVFDTFQVSVHLVHKTTYKMAMLYTLVEHYERYTIYDNQPNDTLVIEDINPHVLNFHGVKRELKTAIAFRKPEWDVQSFSVIIDVNEKSDLIAMINSLSWVEKTS